MALQPGYYWYRDPNSKFPEDNNGWTLISIDEYEYVTWCGSEEMLKRDEVVKMMQIGEFVRIDPPEDKTRKYREDNEALVVKLRQQRAEKG